MSTATLTPIFKESPTDTCDRLFKKWESTHSLDTDDILALKRMNATYVRGFCERIKPTITPDNYDRAANIADILLRTSDVYHAAHILLEPQSGCDTSVIISLLRDGVPKYGTIMLMTSYLAKHAPHASFENNQYAIRTLATLIANLKNKTDGTKKSPGDWPSLILQNYERELKNLVDYQLSPEAIAKNMKAGKAVELTRFFSEMENPDYPVGSLLSLEQRYIAKHRPALIRTIDAHTSVNTEGPEFEHYRKMAERRTPAANESDQTRENMFGEIDQRQPGPG